MTTERIYIVAIPPKAGRWYTSHKAELLERLRRRDLTMEDAMARFDLSLEELTAWQRDAARDGRDGLKATRVHR